MHETLIERFRLYARSEFMRPAHEFRQTKKLFFKAGVAQVTAVAANKGAVTTEAGVSPHAPQLSKRGRPRKTESKSGRITIRFPESFKAQITRRVKLLKSTYASYFYELAARDMRLTPDPELIVKHRFLKEAYNRNTVALNRIGNLFNQITAASHKGLPCPFSREELQEIRLQHAAACRAHLGRPDHDH